MEKPTLKPSKGPNLVGFDSWMALRVWFCSCRLKIRLLRHIEGVNQTFPFINTAFVPYYNLFDFFTHV